MEKYQHLSLVCRVELKVLRDQGASIRVAARALGRSVSSISRELKPSILDSLQGVALHFCGRPVYFYAGDNEIFCMFKLLGYSTKRLTATMVIIYLERTQLHLNVDGCRMCLSSVAIGVDVDSLLAFHAMHIDFRGSYIESLTHFPAHYLYRRQQSGLKLRRTF